MNGMSKIDCSSQFKGPMQNTAEGLCHPKRFYLLTFFMSLAFGLNSHECQQFHLLCHVPFFFFNWVISFQFNACWHCYYQYEVICVRSFAEQFQLTLFPCLPFGRERYCHRNVCVSVNMITQLFHIRSSPNLVILFICEYGRSLFNDVMMMSS